MVSEVVLGTVEEVVVGGEALGIGEADSAVVEGSVADLVVTAVDLLVATEADSVATEADSEATGVAGSEEVTGAATETEVVVVSEDETILAEAEASGIIACVLSFYYPLLKHISEVDAVVASASRAMADLTAAAVMVGAQTGMDLHLGERVGMVVVLHQVEGLVV